jgi:hypothetical protein
MTAWICSSVAMAFITIIISRSPGASTLERDTSAAEGEGSPAVIGARSLGTLAGRHAALAPPAESA